MFIVCRSEKRKFRFIRMCYLLNTKLRKRKDIKLPWNFLRDKKESKI